MRNFFNRMTTGRRVEEEQIPTDPCELARKTIKAFHDCFTDEARFANDADKEAFGETLVNLDDIGKGIKKLEAGDVGIRLLQFLWKVAKNTHDATHGREVRFRIQHNNTDYIPLYTINNNGALHNVQYCSVKIVIARDDDHIAPVWSDVIEKLTTLLPPIEKNPDDDQHTTDIDGMAQHADSDRMLREIFGRIGLEVDEVKAHFDMRINGLEELLLKNQNNRIEIDNEAYKIEFNEAILINVKRDTANVDIPRSIGVYNGRYYVRRISFGVFRDCESTLVSVTIPESVEDIAPGTFDNCTKLREINVAEGNSRYSSKNGILYDKSGTELIKYPAGNGATEFTIPDRVTAIGQGAFKNCTSLRSIFIPSTVQRIGDNAFENCNIVKATMPANAIAYMPTLRILESAKVIGNKPIPKGAFSSSFTLKTVTICGSVLVIGNGAFYGCGVLESVSIENGVREIADSAFRDCRKLNSISIPDSVQVIGAEVFSSCKSLHSVTIGSGVKKIGINAFRWCFDLQRAEFLDRNGWSYEGQDCDDAFKSATEAAECLREIYRNEYTKR